MAFSLDVEIEPREGWAESIEDDVDRILRRTRETLRAVLQRQLRRRGSAFWPWLTGNSARRFGVRLRSNRLEVTNSAPYVPYVNNRRSYPSGRPNPNFQALERSIERLWPEVVREVLADPSVTR